MSTGERRPFFDPAVVARLLTIWSVRYHKVAVTFQNAKVGAIASVTG
jgi:hypothetical protein